MTQTLPANGVNQVEALLHPRNIVLVGASDKPRSYSERIYNNLVGFDYVGKVFPINPKRDTIWGVPCYPDFGALPEAPDHVVVIVPAPAVARVLRNAAAAGARSATIITSGFSEMPDAGSQRLAAELNIVIRETGLAVTGPNCLGNLSTVERMFTNIDDRPVSMVPGKVGIVGQSGAVVMLMRHVLNERGIDVQYMVTTGNEAGLTTPDFMSYFAQSSDVDIIVVYMEAVRDHQAFLAACYAARENGKPVVLIKLGASEAGRAAAMAHTGALAGSIETFDAVTGKAGVIRARSVETMLEIVEGFTHAKRPKGNRVAAIFNSGGKRGLMIDIADELGLHFPELDKTTTARLSEMMGPGSSVGNPLDAGFAAIMNPDVYVQAAGVMIVDPDIDVLILEAEVMKAANPFREKNLEKVNEIARHSGKTVIYLSLANYGFTDYSVELRRRLPDVAFMMGLEKALIAIRAMIDYSALPEIAGPPRSTSTEEARGVLEKVLVEPTGRALDEVVSKQLLSAYGIPVSQEETATSADQAVEIAERIGYPVVAKVVSRDILHKSDIGGVVLNLTSAGAVRTAFADITARVEALPGSPSYEGILIAQQVSGDLELVVGGSFDHEVGPVVLFGSGGVDIELMKDVNLAPAPLSPDEARAQIAKTRAGVKIAGYRGKPALHEQSAVDALVGLSNLMADAGGRIASIDVNPFLLNEKLGIAADALVVLSDAATPPETTD